MDVEDKWHLGIGFVLAGASITSIFQDWNICISIFLAFALCVYLSILIIECARKSTEYARKINGLQKSNFFRVVLPNRTWALLLVVFLVIANVSIFANIYIQSKGVEYKEAGLTNIMTDKMDSVYFSAVTVTTLGSGDFTPNKEGRIYVLLHLASGLILLFYVIPVIASRISSWQ